MTFASATDLSRYSLMKENGFWAFSYCNSKLNNLFIDEDVNVEC